MHLGVALYAGSYDVTFLALSATDPWCHTRLQIVKACPVFGLSLPRSHLFLLVLDHELDLIFFSFSLGDL